MSVTLGMMDTIDSYCQYEILANERIMLGSFVKAQWCRIHLLSYQSMRDSDRSCELYLNAGTSRGSGNEFLIRL